MHQMIELHPQADALDVLGLPAIPYPVALPVFQAAVANDDGELPLIEMLRGLQLRAAQGAGWQRLAPAMARLSELVAGDDGRSLVPVDGEGWRIEVGPLAAGEGVVALVRDDVLLAAAAGGGDGALRVAAWHPLDAGSIGRLVDLARTDRDAAGGEDLSPWHGQWMQPPRRPACVAADITAWNAPRG